MCLKPVQIKVPQTNLSIFPNFAEYISVPCGKCEECRISHAKEWAARCMCEFYSRPIEEQNRSWFITLTYDDKHCPGVLKPNDVSKFIKRFRKRYSDYKIKFFYCGEYGSRTLRPHYHMIVYNLPIDDLCYLRDNLYTSKTLEKLWGNGLISIGLVSLQSCNYVARYAIKKNVSDCFIRMSNGFGKQYFLDHMEDIISNGYITLPKNDRIVKVAIPRYFTKIYRSIVGDKVYNSWMVHRLKSINDHLQTVEVRYKNNLNKIDYINRIRLGVLSEAQKLNAKDRKLLNDAYYDFCKSRDII